MSAFFTFLFTIFFFALLFIGIGFVLMSRMVGGFGNLRALYRLFTGKGSQQARPHTAQSSASGSSSQSRTQSGKARPTSRPASSANGKEFGENEGIYVDFEEVKD